MADVELSSIRLASNGIGGQAADVTLRIEPGDKDGFDRFDIVFGVDYGGDPNKVVLAALTELHRLAQELVRATAAPSLPSARGSGGA